MPSAVAVAGIWGLIIVFIALLFFSLLFTVSSIVKIGAFAACTICLFNTAKKLNKGSFLRNLALAMVFASAAALFGYVLLVDINPMFLNIPAKSCPKLCELHDSPVFFLSITRIGNLMDGDFYGDYYDECMQQTGSFEYGLESCNGVKESIAADCIETAVASVNATAADCRLLEDSHYQWMCLNDVGLDKVTMEDCEMINYTSHRSQCIVDVATAMEDCEKISAGSRYQDDCYKKLAATPEECGKIRINWIRNECFWKLLDAGIISEEECEALTGYIE